MELRQIRYAVRLADTLHFGRAAEAEHIAQSAFSVQIARLERHLGVQLFERTARAVRVTEPGELFIRRAQTMLAGLDELTHETRALGRPVQTLRVGTFSEAAGELTPYIFESYRLKNPHVQVTFTELTMTSQFESLLCGEVDVALLRSPFHDERVTLHPIFAEPRMLACSRRSRFAEAESVTVGDFIDQPFAVAGPDVPREWSGFWALDDVRGEASRIGAHVRSVGECMMAISNLDAVDTVPSTTTRYLQTSGVVFVPIEDASATTVTVGVRSQDERPHVRAFIDAAHAACDRHIDVVPGAFKPKPLAA